MDQPLFHITQRLGAVPTENNPHRVQFRLFFPANVETHITSIRVGGSFQSKSKPPGQDWKFEDGPQLVKEDTPGEYGEFWTAIFDSNLDDGFYEYKYFVTFEDHSTRFVADPCARYSGQDQQNSGFVIGGSTAQMNAVKPLMTRKPLKDLIVYEMHIGDFTKEFLNGRAPLDAVQDKLDYLKDLGINAILFEPWTAWKDKNFDWGYQPFQYFAVEYAYANDAKEPWEKISKLKKLITACHQRGIHVIMDGVYNHCDESFPYKFFYADPSHCPYTAEAFGGTFPGLQDLDFYNECTQAFIRDVCLYWISEFKIDGIRFDNTVNFDIPGDPRGLPDLLQSIYDYENSQGGQNFSLTLEHLQMDAVSVVNTTEATSYWDNGLFGACFGELWNGSVPTNYLNLLNNIRFLDDPEKRPTLYLSNHDHSTVAFQAGASSQSQNAAKWFRTQPHMIALLTSPCVPMITMGQEFAAYEWLPDDGPGRVVSRPLHWGDLQGPFGSRLHPVYQKLLNIRNSHPALRTRNFSPSLWPDNGTTSLDRDGVGVDTDKGLVVYRRWGPNDNGGLEHLYVCLNFADTDQRVTVHFEEKGSWKDLLNDTSVQVSNFVQETTISSNWGCIFFKQAKTA